MSRRLPSRLYWWNERYLKWVSVEGSHEAIYQLSDRLRSHPSFEIVRITDTEPVAPDITERNISHNLRYGIKIRDDRFGWSTPEQIVITKHAEKEVGE